MKQQELLSLEKKDSLLAEHQDSITNSHESSFEEPELSENYDESP